MPDVRVLRAVTRRDRRTGARTALPGVPGVLPYGLLALSCTAAGVLGEPTYALVAGAVVGAKLSSARVLGARLGPELTALGLPPVADTALVRTLTRAGRPAAAVVLGPALAGAIVLLQDRSGLPAAAALALLTLAVPLELPVVVSALLTAGARRMARRGAVVRRLSTVETAGATTVVCAHTTGFLTQRRDAVTTVVADGRTYDVTGEDVRTGAGRVTLGEDVALDACLLAGLACNDARIVDEQAPVRVSGAPAGAALVVSAARLGVTKPPPRVATLPYTPARRYMATLHRRTRGEPGVIHVKGAADRVLYLCRDRLDRTGARRPLDRDTVLAAAHALAARGLRVLAFARADVPAGLGTLTEEALPGLVFLGLQALHDPPRPTAADAVRACRAAGVQVKLLTADDPVAGGAFADWVGLRPVTSGAELAGHRAADVPDAAGRAAVFARMSAADEILLVDALHVRRQVVTYLDGADVSPARDRADTGAAPPDADADLVVLDGDFASAVAAIAEGRRALDDAAKAVAGALAGFTALSAGACALLAVAAPDRAWPALGVLLPVVVLAAAFARAWTRGSARRLLGYRDSSVPGDDGNPRSSKGSAHGRRT